MLFCDFCYFFRDHSQGPTANKSINTLMNGKMMLLQIDLMQSHWTRPQIRSLTQTFIFNIYLPFYSVPKCCACDIYHLKCPLLIKKTVLQKGTPKKYKNLSICLWSSTEWKPKDTKILSLAHYWSVVCIYQWTWT